MAGSPSLNLLGSCGPERLLLEVTVVVPPTLTCEKFKLTGPSLPVVESAGWTIMLAPAGVLMQSRSRIETLFEPQFAVARSCLPSPLKSPTVTPKGEMKTLKFLADAKPPDPFPKRIDTFAERKFGTAKD